MSTRKSSKLAACATVGVAAALLTSASAFAAPGQSAHARYHAHYQADAHKRHTPPDSFLVYKVYSIDELIAQVKSNPRIKEAYAEHFNVPQSRVIEYMRANLVESYVPETRVYTCYCLRDNGLVYPVKQVFKRGTKVFALRNGEPVLKWVCGNPLSKFLPAVETHTVVRDVPVIKMAPSTEIIAPTDTVQVVVPTESVADTKSSSDFEVMVPPAITTAAVPVAASFILAPAAAAGGSWALASLPVAFAALAAHSNLSSNNSTGGSPGGIPKPVPEASTMETSAVLLAAGAFFLGLRRRALRRNS